MEFKDYYEILGVKPDADDKEIKQSYRRLARKYHPDVSSEDDAEAQFKEVTEAYEVLKDSGKRAEYDELRKYGGTSSQVPPEWEPAGSAGQGEFHGGFSDFFESVFGGAGHSSHRGYSREQFAQRGEDIEFELALLLEEAYQGCEHTISFDVPVFDDTGRLRRDTRTLKVKIPKGTTDGDRIRLKGQGAPGIGDAPSGDLYLITRLADHPLFDVNGKDLSIIVPLAPWEAVLGTQLNLMTLDGVIKLRIPANSQSGKRLRIAGKGMGRGDNKGDLYAVINIVIPTENSESDQELWRQLETASSFDARADWAGRKGAEI